MCANARDTSLLHIGKKVGQKNMPEKEITVTKLISDVAEKKGKTTGREERREMRRLAFFFFFLEIFYTYQKKKSGVGVN